MSRPLQLRWSICVDRYSRRVVTVSCETAEAPESLRYPCLSSSLSMISSPRSSCSRSASSSPRRRCGVTASRSISSVTARTSRRSVSRPLWSFAATRTTPSDYSGFRRHCAPPYLLLVAVVVQVVVRPLCLSLATSASVHQEIEADRLLRREPLFVLDHVGVVEPFLVVAVRLLEALFFEKFGEFSLGVGCDDDIEVRGETCVKRGDSVPPTRTYSCPDRVSSSSSSMSASLRLLKLMSVPVPSHDTRRRGRGLRTSG